MTEKDLEQSEREESEQEAAEALEPDEVQAPATHTEKATDDTCPNCGAAMVFDPTSGKLVCDDCDASVEVENKEKDTGPLKEKKLDTVALHTPKDWGTKKKVVACKACGASIIYDATQLADKCPYCESNHVMVNEDDETVPPDGISPFKVTADQAATFFRTWISKKWFIPNVVRDHAKPECMKGVYLPFWTFDSQTKARYKGEYGVPKKTKSRKKDNESQQLKWFPVQGNYSEFFDDFPVPATSKHGNDFTTGIGPFLTESSVPYKPQYASGFLAERYDIDAETAWKTGDKEIREEIVEHIKSDIKREKGAVDVRISKIEYSLEKPACKYLLLPMYLATYKYENKVYHFAVNGDTGTYDGTTPLSWMKAILAILAVLAIGLIFLPATPVLIIVGIVAFVLISTREDPGPRKLSEEQQKKRNIHHTMS